MLRLYLRFYLALLASIVIFGLSAAVVWHIAGGPLEQAGLSLSRLVQNILPPAEAAPAEQAAALQRLAAGVRGDVTLLSREGQVIAAIGAPLRAPPPRGRILSIWHATGASVSTLRLADGRVLIASVPIGLGNSRAIFHLMLFLLAAAIGVAAFPLTRQITARLVRLQRGVESLGSGDWTARVAVEGRDEVARLAASFNRAAAQIEQLMHGHRTFLAHASHELRTPLTRIRLAVELLKAGADANTKLGLEQDIAELDALVDEILLASRLEAVKDNDSSEEIDLLALAAEECARYEQVVLNGVALKVRGDPRLLRRLLRNLLENARLHGTPPTQMRIALNGGGGATILVWDAGSGPASVEFEQVFIPFQGRDHADPRSHGLGLSLVRQIARRHGGDAHCEFIKTGHAGFVITLAA